MKIRAKAIMWVYFAMILICFLDVAHSTALTQLLRKLRYPYIAFMAVAILSDSDRYTEIYKGSRTVLAALFLHTVLFGKIFVNQALKPMIEEHFSMMFVFLLLLLVTFCFVRAYGMKMMFIQTSYLALALTLLYAFVRYPVIRHPKFWLWTFTGGIRWKENYGFIDANYTGYYCFAAIVLSLFLLDAYVLQKRRGWGFYLIVAMDCLIGLMMLSTGSRSSILSTFLACGMYLFFRPEFLTKRYGVIIRGAFVVALAAIGLLVFAVGVQDIWNYVWENSNREYNVTFNYAAFVGMDAWKTGMGYVESTAFATDVFAGYDTWNIDMYYLYIFFSTGIAGAAIIAAALLRLAVRAFFFRVHPQWCVVFSVYAAMLFNAVWQVNLFTYRFYPSLCLGVVLLLYSCETQDHVYMRKWRKVKNGECAR